MSTDAPTAAWRVRTQPNTVPRSAKVPPATDLGATRPARRRSRARWLWITALAGALALALAVVGFGALVWSWVDQRHVLLPGSTTGVTYLLVGSDSRAFVHSASDRARFGPGSATGPERADIALLVRRVGGHTTVLDVPRDLVVLSTGSAPTRYVLTLTDGLQSLVDVTCHSLGIGVDHVALVHFDGLRGAVDAVGGVDVTFSTPLRDRVTGLLVPAAGRHLLDGQQALALVRARTLEREVAGRWEPVPPSADQRGGHVCEVLAALGARGGLSVGAPVSSARKLLAFSAAVTVDDTMGPTGLRSLAHTLAAVGTAHEVQLPVQFRAGFVPRALAEPAALSVLRRFGGPSGRVAPLGCHYKQERNHERNVSSPSWHRPRRGPRAGRSHGRRSDRGRRERARGVAQPDVGPGRYRDHGDPSGAVRIDDGVVDRHAHPRSGQPPSARQRVRQHPGGAEQLDHARDDRRPRRRGGRE